MPICEKVEERTSYKRTFLIMFYYGREFNLKEEPERTK